MIPFFLLVLLEYLEEDGISVEVKPNSLIIFIYSSSFHYNVLCMIIN
jgi:hypothetical protein